MHDLPEQSRAVNEWSRTHDAEWQSALAALRADGWQAELTCIAAPVQIEGRLPGGEPFYFRARWDEVTLSIGGEDPADVADWEGREAYPEASYLSGADGLAILRRLAARYGDKSGDRPPD